jgi:hypothetical protein
METPDARSGALTRSTLDVVGLRKLLGGILPRLGNHALLLGGGDRDIALANTDETWPRRFTQFGLTCSRVTVN